MHLFCEKCHGVEEYDPPKELTERFRVYESCKEKKKINDPRRRKINNYLRCKPCKEKRVINDVKCQVCQKDILVRGLSENHDGLTFLKLGFKISCEGCRKIDSFVRGWSKDQPDCGVYEEFEVRVLYSVTEKEHEGYCSDPHDETEATYEMAKTYPIPKNIILPLEFGTQADPSISHPISLETAMKSYYAKHSSDRHDNQYCGCSGKDYEVLSYTVVRRLA